MNLKQTIRRILREEDYSPAGKEIIPNKIVVHKSNPMFRDKILEEGLKARAGECYKIYVGYGIKCKPAIFATNSINKRAWFDSTYDDDVWEINTEMIPDVKWFKDRHYESRSKHIVTFQDIPVEAITLKYKGTGSGDVRTWDKDSPNIVRESIRRILREEILKESFVPGVWGDGDNNYSIDRLVKLVKDREPTTMSIDKIINKNSDLETKEGNFKENIKKPTKLFKQRTIKANTEYPVMISEEGWIIDGSHRIAKQKWDGVKKVKVHIISKEDLKKCKITNQEELKKSKEIKY